MHLTNNRGWSKPSITSSLILLLAACSGTPETSSRPSMAQPSTTQAATSQPSTQSCQRVVESFYEWYVPKASSTSLNGTPGPAFAIAIRDRSSLFSPALRQALQKDLDAQRKANGEIVGIDFDPFVASQDPYDRYDVRNVRTDGSACWADIYEHADPSPAHPSVVTELRDQGGQWVFVNFHYEPDNLSGNNNLVNTLHQLHTARQSSED